MSETVTDYLELLAQGGLERIVGGNTPFLLDRPDTVWLIRSGKVEVFSVVVEDGGPRGARRHFFTAHPGDLLFGMDLERYGEGQAFLAVGMVGTQIVEVPLARVRELASLPTTAEAFVPLVERWVAGLSAGVARTIVPHPRVDVTVDAGEPATLGDGKRLRTRKGVAWVRHTGGSSLFVGMEDVADTPAGAWMPITAETWLHSMGSSALVSTGTQDALAGDAGWEGLEGFYALVFRCEFFNSRLQAADELNRLKEKADRDRRVHHSSLSDLVGVLHAPLRQMPAGAADDPLFAACAVVGQHLGVTMRPAARRKEDEQPVDPLAEIARASRVRLRKVMLKGEWWRDETGPLLAYAAEDARPVAILPKGPGRLLLVDPQTGSQVPVRGAVAATLAPAAYSFYRPFPDKKLTPIDVFRFGVFNSRRDLIRPVLVGIGAGLLAMLPPFFTGMLVDTVIPESANAQLVQLAIVLGIVGLTSTAFDTVRNLSLLRLEAKMSAAVQPAMWDRLLGLPVAFFRRFNAGDLAQRVNSVDAMRRVLSGTTLHTVMTSVFSLFLLAQMFIYSWPLALVGLGLVLVAVLATMLAGYLRLRQQREIITVEGHISGLVLQLLTGIAKLRVTGAENRAFAEWAREFAKQKRIALRTGGVENGLAIFNSAFPVVSTLVLFYTLLIWAPQWGGTLSAGRFIAFNAAFGTFLGQMLAMGTAIMSALLVIPLYERAKPILQSLPEVDLTKSDPGELAGRIDVDHVSFRYHEDGPLILDDVSIRMLPGEFIAIVGPSGSGKSTLLRLLLGLDVPESGSIYYDGKNLALLDVSKLRRRVGVVMQTGRIRAGSILDNIIGSAPLTMDDAWEAAQMAGFDEDVKQMPMGMQTVLQQGGLTLSGGQRQRLMIARAIVNKPRVLLFDEATSALDNRTQAIVSRSLEELQATRVAIAHRLSTVINADRIYVMEAGRVVQAGSYSELIGQPGMFAELVRRQIA